MSSDPAFCQWRFDGYLLNLVFKFFYMYFLQTNTDKMQWLYWVLPIVGVLLIIFCVLAYFSKIGLKVRDKVQEFKFLGTELKISVITFFVLVGMIFIFFWVYLSYNDLLGNLKTNNDALLQLNESLKVSVKQKETEISTMQKAQNKSISFNLSLEGLSGASINDLRSFTAYYRTFDKDQNVPLDIIPTGVEERNKFKITINDISVSTFITALVIKHKDDTWMVENFAPLNPTLTLKKAN